MSSIEQRYPFHQARRILKILFPEYRLFANPNLKQNESVLDVKNKTIEVSEDTELLQAIACLCFQMGHLRLKNNKEFSLLFGRGICSWKKTDASLIKELARQGVKADKRAAKWAINVFKLFFPAGYDAASQMISKMMWTHEEWVDYFS